jgi:hypothetical protein
VARARTKAQRLRQVEAWLREHFRTPWPVVVEYCDDWPGREPDDFGETTREGRTIVIRVLRRMPLIYAIEMLCHEWAHAVDWRPEMLDAHRQHHAEEWGVTYAKIYTAFYDDGGVEESKEYPW